MSWLFRQLGNAAVDINPLTRAFVHLVKRPLTVHRKKRLIGINAIRQKVIELLHRFVIRRNQTSGDQRSHRQPLVLRFVERFVRIGRRNGGIQRTGQSDS